MVKSIVQILRGYGFQEKWTLPLANLAVILLILLASAFAYWFVKKVLAKVVGAYTKLSKNKWDEIFNHHLLARIAKLAPAIVIHTTAPAFPGQQIWIQRLAFSYIILMAVLIAFSLLDGFEAIYRTFRISREKPIKGLLQVVKIIAARPELLSQILKKGRLPLEYLAKLTGETKKTLANRRRYLLALLAVAARSEDFPFISTYLGIRREDHE